MRSNSVALLLTALLVGARARAVEPEAKTNTEAQANTAKPEPQTNTAEQPETTPEAEQPDPLSGSFKLEPRGMLVINGIYSSRGALPGAYALFVVRPVITGDQFIISPNDTTVGFAISGVSFRSVQFSGALDVNLKSPNPLTSPNSLSPQFYDVHVAARSKYLDLIMGQFPDVILPFLVPTTNGFPGTFLPGQLGAVRPQARADARLPLGERFELRLQGSLGRPLTTFQLADELYGVSAGLPDVQGRVALAAGAPVRDEVRARPYEIGIGAHWARRRILDAAGQSVTDQEFDSWSIGGDVRVDLPSGTGLLFRIWTGSLLGDYAGGVFQTVSTTLVEPIAAHGFLVAVSQHLGAGWRVNAGWGHDNPENSNLGSGERTVNEAGFVNVFWNWSRIIGFALEGSRWRTGFKDQGSTTAWRGEFLAISRF